MKKYSNIWKNIQSCSFFTTLSSKTKFSITIVFGSCLLFHLSSTCSDLLTLMQWISQFLKSLQTRIWITETSPWHLSNKSMVCSFCRAQHFVHKQSAASSFEGLKLKDFSATERTSANTLENLLQWNLVNL